MDHQGEQGVLLEFLGLEAFAFLLFQGGEDVEEVGLLVGEFFDVFGDGGFGLFVGLFRADDAEMVVDAFDVEAGVGDCFVGLFVEELLGSDEGFKDHFVLLLLDDVLDGLDFPFEELVLFAEVVDEVVGGFVELERLGVGELAVVFDEVPLVYCNSVDEEREERRELLDFYFDLPGL